MFLLSKNVFAFIVSYFSRLMQTRLPPTQNIEMALNKFENKRFEKSGRMEYFLNEIRGQRGKQ